MLHLTLKDSYSDLNKHSPHNRFTKSPPNHETLIFDPKQNEIKIIPQDRLGLEEHGNTNMEANGPKTNLESMNEDWNNGALSPSSFFSKSQLF